MSDTESDLKEAFAGESQANRKYLAFARKAEQEGFANVARLFRTAAEAETIHAFGHLAALDGVGTTAENLKAASPARPTSTGRCTRRCWNGPKPPATAPSACSATR